MIKLRNTNKAKTTTKSITVVDTLYWSYASSLKFKQNDLKAVHTYAASCCTSINTRSVFTNASPPLKHIELLSLAIRYDTRCYFNVRSKADMSQRNLPHGTNN